MSISYWYRHLIFVCLFVFLVITDNATENIVNIKISIFSTQ